MAITSAHGILRPDTPALWISTSMPSCATARSEASDLCRLAHVEGMQHNVAHECAEHARPGWRACRGVHAPTVGGVLVSQFQAHPPARANNHDGRYGTLSL
jgi:hypothetical protein